MPWKRSIAVLTGAVALTSLLATDVAGQRRDRNGDRPSSERIFLGEQTVGFRVDRDVINVGQSEDWFRTRSFRALRFSAERNDVHMMGIRLVYLNGFAEDLRIDRPIQKDGELRIELKGERSFLKRIEMTYRSRPNFRGQAVIKVYGELARRDRPDVADWNELDTERFNRSEERVVLRVKRGEGRLGQIRLRALDDRVHVIDIRIRFRNGEAQSVELDQSLEPGEHTRAIDLEGDQRRVEEVLVNLRPGRRPGQTGLTLLGTERPGRSDGRQSPGAGWELLGEQRVGFRIDRDVIRIDHAEDWYKNRAFRALHFAAEGNDVHMTSIRLVYLNGYSEEFNIDRLIREGEQLPLDLRGERSFIREIQMIYRSRRDFGGQATIKVYGEPVGRFEAPRGDWVELGCQQVSLFGKDRDSVQVGRQEGRFKAIRLHVRGADVEVIDLKVIYANGQPDDIPVKRRLSAGERTRPLDLEGWRRSIERVDMVYRSEFNPLEALAKQRVAAATVCIEGQQ